MTKEATLIFVSKIHILLDKGWFLNAVHGDQENAGCVSILYFIQSGSKVDLRLQELSLVSKLSIGNLDLLTFAAAVAIYSCKLSLLQVCSSIRDILIVCEVKWHLWDDFDLK